MVREKTIGMWIKDIKRAKVDGKEKTVQIYNRAILPKHYIYIDEKGGKDSITIFIEVAPTKNSDYTYWRYLIILTNSKYKTIDYFNSELDGKIIFKKAEYAKKGAMEYYKPWLKSVHGIKHY